MKQKLNLFILFLILFIGQVNYVKADTTIASGTISGTSIKWAVISPNGAQENLKLSFTGSGKIPDFYYSDSPWESYNSKITQVSIPSTITEIGDAAFDYCSSLQEINIPFCKKIGISAFEGCTSLKKVNIASCTEIGKSAFENCFGLQEINIPSCTKIAIAAFRGCTSLKEIYIPSCVESIGSQAFNGCSSLTSICYEGRCTANTSIEFFGVAANGKFLEKSGSGTSYAQVPSGWTYSTHNGMTRSYVADGTLYVKGNGAYTTSISSASWYSQRNSIKKIVVEEGVTDICDYAFKDCANVTEVTLKNTGTIGNAAFSGCTALTRVNIGAGLTEFKYASSSTYYPFSGCSNLSEVNVADLASFLKIANLYYLTNSPYGTAEEKTLKVNGTTHSSSSELVIPEGVTEIPSVAFRNFKNVTKIRLPSTMTKIADYNFQYHHYLTQITLPSSVTSVGESAFSGCTALTTVTLPSSVTSVGESAFSGCTALKTVTLNNSGTIGNWAFSGCTALTRVNIGTGLTEFKSASSSSYPFKGCSNLSEVNVADLASFLKIANLYYLTNSPYGTAEEKTLKVNGTTHSSSSELVIPEGVTEIPSVAFRNFKNVTKIKLPSTMTKIADYNFQYHHYLTQITLPSSVTSVGESAFSGCTALTTVTLPSSVTSVGSSAFYGCKALTTVTLNNSGTIGDYAFANCTALTRVNIGTGLTEFKSASSSSYPFKGCSNLSEVNVADLASFLKIANLYYLTNSPYGTAEEKTLMVNGNTHSSSSELVIPEGVTEINRYAFRNFKNVTKIKLPSTMTKIADYNFQFHNYLKKITLPSTITSIGAYAFCYSDNLKRIVCKATTPPATTSIIASNPSEISLKVPTGKTSTYKAANVWKEFSIDEGRTLNYNVTMLANESKQVTNDLLDYQNVESRTTTNSSIATSTVSSNIVTIKAGNNPTYDGTTTNPYKSAVIRLYLEDDDQLVYNVSVTPREAELTDGNAYMNTKEFEVDKVSYTRSFSEKIIGKWQCFYAPFDIEITDELLEDFDFAKLYMVSYKDENDNGEIEDGEPLKMMLNKLSAGKILHANKPYFVKTKSACTKTFVATNAVLKAAARGSVRCCTTEHEYSLVGIYNPTNIKGFYTMGTSGGFSYYTTDKTINQYRWYMEIKSLTEDGGEYENYARPIEIFVEGEDETTGIIALENNVSDSQNDKIYTLDGRQVTDFETLPSGIYIVNGKKVFKK